MAVFGGIAVQIWGRVRSTLDADILVDATSTAPRAVVEAMRSAGFAHQERIDQVRLDDAHLERWANVLGLADALRAARPWREGPSPS